MTSLREFLSLPPMSLAQIDRVRTLEKFSRQNKQINIPVNQVLHAGMYARTVVIPKGG